MPKKKGIIPSAILVGFAIFAVMLFILPLIVGNVRIALNPTLANLGDAAINASVANVQTQFNNAITLLAVALIVAAASVIIIVTSGLGGGGGLRR